MLERDAWELRSNLDRRVHVAKRRRENELVPARGQLADHAFRIGTLGHVFDELGRHFGAERFFHFLAPLIVLIGPSGITDRAHIDEADLERFLRQYCSAGANAERAAGGQRGEEAGHSVAASHGWISCVKQLECRCPGAGRGQALRASTKHESCNKLAGGANDGFLLRSIGPVGSAERHRRIEPYGIGVARDEYEHYDRRQVGQGREQLRRHGDA